MAVDGPWTVWTSGVGQKPAEREPHQAGVVVDDVEVLVAGEAIECVLELPEVWPIRSLGASSKTAASFARVRESPEAKRVTSWPASASAVGEQRDDPLDPAVAGGGNREPDRAENGDPRVRALPLETNANHGRRDHSSAVAQAAISADSATASSR